MRRREHKKIFDDKLLGNTTITFFFFFWFSTKQSRGIKNNLEITAMRKICQARENLKLVQVYFLFRTTIDKLPK